MRLSTTTTTKVANATLMVNGTSAVYQGLLVAWGSGCGMF